MSRAESYNLWAFGREARKVRGHQNGSGTVDQGKMSFRQVGADQLGLLVHVRPDKLGHSLTVKQDHISVTTCSKM